MKRYAITWIENDTRKYEQRETKKSALKVACDNYKYNPTVCDSKTNQVFTSQEELERM
jgi:hypothetical protein